MARRRPAEGYARRRPGTRNYPSSPSVKPGSRSAATTRKPDTAAGKAAGTKKTTRPVAPPERAAQIRRSAQARRQQTVRSAVSAIGSGPAVAAARFGVSQATKRLPKAVDVPGGARKALDFGSRAARTSGKALSRWWSGY